MDGQVASTMFGVILAVAAASDAAARRISNRLTLPLALGGVAVQFVAGGLTVAGGALAVAAVVGVALWEPWRRGWLGGGDWKLAVGAATWVGWRGLPAYVLVSAVVGGALSLAAYLASSARSQAEIRANLRAVTLAQPISVAARAAGGRASVPAGAAFAAGALYAVLGG